MHVQPSPQAAGLISKIIHDGKKYSGLETKPVQSVIHAIGYDVMTWFGSHVGPAVCFTSVSARVWSIYEDSSMSQTNISFCLEKCLTFVLLIVCPCCHIGCEWKGLLRKFDNQPKCTVVECTQSDLLSAKHNFFCCAKTSLN